MNIDEMIAEAFKEEFEERVKQSACNTKKHRFSLSYRLWERKMLRNAGRGRVNTRWTVKRMRAAVASVAAAAFILVGGTAYAAVNIWRYSFDTKPEYSKLFIDNLSSDKTSIEDYYELPEEDGWKIIDYYADDIGTAIQYENGDRRIVFRQEVIIYIDTIHINTEDAVVEPLSLFEENDGFFVAFKDGDCGIFWIYDGFFFEMLGNINKNEAINLAYSTKIADP